MSLLPIIGLVLNVIGSSIFILDSNRFSTILSNMVGHIAKGHGKMDSQKFEKDELQTLIDKISDSKKLTYLEYGLFIFGFILQLTVAICNQ